MCLLPTEHFSHFPLEHKEQIEKAEEQERLKKEKEKKLREAEENASEQEKKPTEKHETKEDIDELPKASSQVSLQSSLSSFYEINYLVINWRKYILCCRSLHMLYRLIYY